MSSRQAPSLSFLDVFRFAVGYWTKQPKKLTLILFMVVAAALLESNIPNTLSAFLGAIRQKADESVIWWRLGIFVVNYLTQAMLISTAYIIYNSFETTLFKTLVDDIFIHVHRLSEQFFINTFSGSIISKINRARHRIEIFEDRTILRMLPTAVILLGSTGFLALRFPALAVWVLGCFLFIFTVSAFLVFRIIGPIQLAYTEAEDVFGANLADSISGIATTKSYAQEDLEENRFLSVTEKLRAKNFLAYASTNSIGLLQQFLLVGMLAVLLGGGTWYFLHGQANIEDMAYLALTYTIIQSYVSEIGDNIKNILTASYDLHAVIHLLQETPNVKDKPNAKALSVTSGAIDFANVTFSYPGKLESIFKDFSLSIKAGERVALVGHSGSGKTTFLRLLQHAYDVQQGSISIDGQDITDHTQKSLRSSIALVPQDPILFHRSLKDNIAYANPTATLEEIRKAAQQAHIDDFIQGIPQQYDTLVGERGIKLSGGERQRVAIARAILANRPILILDEATSSLDSVSEKAIQDALHALIQGRTSIMVAHRLSTILDADRILVFDGGRIIEEGNHAALLAKDGVYAEFFKLQSGGFIGE